MSTGVSHQVDQLQAALAGRYAISRELGRGGMAQVYLARDLRHDRDVAIKILRPELASSLADERFLREIRIEAQLQHPHILPVHESGSAGSFVYYVMPYVAGESLRDRLAREKQLPLADALQITREVGDALAYAHSHGVVHRDIKPGNILLSEHHAVVADFGIARAIEAAGGERLTESGLAIGTPEYMSPEQASGDSAVDGRSDIYALGCVLYEMLVGEPPFRGRTAQAVLARHRSETPPSLQVVRPNVPDSVQSAVETALAKVPADRFATVSDFVSALDAPEGAGRSARRRRARRWRMGGPVALTLAAVASAGIWQLMRQRSGGLDPNRVVVFPLREAGLASEHRGAGENIATLIGYALEGTQPLTWLDGWDFLDDRQRAEAGRVIPEAAREISRARRARYFLDGTIIGGPDTVTVVLRLHDLQGDSVLQRAGASAPALVASLPQLGLRAVSDLLPALLAPGRRVDVSALSERKPAAIANFLQGEREYRRMHFARALEYYHAAVEEDSALAVAALKGAQAANWQSSTEDRQLVEVALRRASFLPARQALFARGLHASYTGGADSAVRHLSAAIGLDSTWSEAWMALGEVYYHLLPEAAPLDSLAEAAFERSRLADTSFTPPLLHLAELAIRRGDVRRAEGLVNAVRKAEADSAIGNPASLMVQCVRDGPAAVDWRRVTRQKAQDVLAAGKLLAVGASQPACGEAAFRAILNADSMLLEQRWAALVGLQSLLIAVGRVEEVPALLASERVSDLPGMMLCLVDAATGNGCEVEARAQAEKLGHAYSQLDVPRLWLLGEWRAAVADTASLRAIVTALEAKRDSSNSRSDSLITAAVGARLPLLTGDSSEALRLLSALKPTAPGSELEWQLWESLGEERMILAELLLARRQFADAYRVAARIDSPQPLTYLLHLRRSLAVRIRAAEALGRSDWLARQRSRLMHLNSHRPVVAGVHSQ